MTLEFTAPADEIIGRALPNFRKKKKSLSKKGVENQASFFIRCLMIFGWFWERFWECLGIKANGNNILIFGIVFKTVF